MYKILFVYDSDELYEQIKGLHIWGEPSDFIIEDVANDGIEAYRKLKEKSYDLVITEIRKTGMDGIQLLRRAKSEGLCSRIALCSKFSDFNYARQGIILGAFDYFVQPFDEPLFFSMFSRIKNESHEYEAKNICYTEIIFDCFKRRDNDIHEHINNIFNEIYSKYTNVINADKAIRNICSSLIDEVFNNYEWLDLYIEPQNFYNLDSINENNQGTYKERYCTIIGDLYNEFARLCPYADDEKIQEVILYILNNPESNLKQKDIANELHINSTYLSTVFMAHTKIRFVDYVTAIKIKRAAYLLENTQMKITDIAERLGYKDIGYFSRLFKKEYEIPPSEYRVLNAYNYEI